MFIKSISNKPYKHIIRGKNKMKITQINRKDMPEKLQIIKNPPKKLYAVRKY